MKIRTLLKLSPAEICKFFKEFGDSLLSTFLHNIETPRIEEVGRARIIGPERELNIVFWNGKFNGIIDSEVNKLSRVERDVIYSQLNMYIHEEEEGD